MSITPSTHVPPGDRDALCSPEAEVAESVPGEPRLRSLVRRYWASSVRWEAGARERIAATDTVELLFDLRPAGHRFSIGGAEAETLPPCFLNGLKLLPVELRFGGAQRFFGVQLRPQALLALFGVSAEEVTDRVVDAADLPRAAGLRTLQERVTEAETFAQRVALVESFLGNLASHAVDRRFDPELLRRCGSVQAAARAVSLSTRQYLRRFEQWQGVAPSVHRRISRFVAAVTALERSRALATIAAEAGYFDQSHLTREFRRLAGVSPGDYVRNHRGPPGHYLVPAR